MINLVDYISGIAVALFRANGNEKNTKRNDLKRDLNMQKASLVAIAVSGLLVCSMNSQAAVITDNYIGANNHGYGDVIGSVSNFQINSMDVNLVGTVLQVSIDTSFAGKAGTLYPGYTTNGTGIGYGDLFLSSSWTPNGTAADQYINDNAATGTTWSYGFSLDNRFRTGTGMGAGTLFELTSGDNNADALLAEDFITHGTYRDGQEVAVDVASQGVNALSNYGAWNVSANSIDFTIDLAGTSLLSGNEIALHWGFTCQNDVIEGSVSTVPVPPALWLFASGLLGLVGVSRRRKA